MMHELHVHTMMRRIVIFFRMRRSDIDIVRKELNYEDAWNEKVFDLSKDRYRFYLGHDRKLGFSC
jgi:hypothetical protein